jgi:hypothetical protein
MRLPASFIVRGRDASQAIVLEITEKAKTVNLQIH